MAERSVPRPSTRMLTADEELCRRAAGLLFCEPAPITDAFLGEPVEVLLGMTRWCIEHEGPDFDPARVLVAWAKRRKRGAWSDRPTDGARVVWGEVPAKLHGCAGCGETRREVHEVGADSLTFHEGDLICEACAADHAVTL